MTRIAVLSAMLIMASSEVFPQNFVDGFKLLSWCESADAADFCAGYVVGVIDGENLSRRDGHRTIYCAPKSADAANLKDVVVKYLRAHPEDHTATAASVVAVALSEVWPCSGR